MSISKTLPSVEIRTFHMPYVRQTPKTDRMVNRINREFIATYRDYSYDDQGNRTVTERSIEAKV